MRKSPRKIKKLSVEKLTEDQLAELGIEDEAGWYIRDPNNEECEWIGPYPTKADANDAKKGVQDFWKYHDI